MSPEYSLAKKNHKKETIKIPVVEVIDNKNKPDMQVKYIEWFKQYHPKRQRRGTR